MNREEVLELIGTGEGYTLEFKESFSSSVDKEICAFANASGGIILLGVKDDNSIKGISSSNRLSSQIQDLVRKFDPPFQVRFEMVDDVGVIFVPEGKDKPYLTSGKAYLRQGSNSQQMNREELIHFLQERNSLSFEKQINKDFDLKKDFDKYKFEIFKEKANISKSLPLKHVLKNLGLLTNDLPNNACSLLFPHRVTKFFLSADISCVLYQGTNKVNMIDKKVFDADFLSNFENAVAFVQRNTRTKADIIDLRRVETPEIPEKAIREAILNAMIHKDYFIEGRILIEIFSDSVVIGNPGKLLFNPKDLGRVSVLRNPVLADCILRTGFVEKIGSGINRIKSLAPNVDFEISDNWFRVVFNREFLPEKDAGVNAGELAGVKFSELQKKIMGLLKNDNSLSAEKMSNLLGKDRRTIERNLAKLSEKEVIERVGSPKTGHWEIINKE